jgi:MFS family permease
MPPSYEKTPVRPDERRIYFALLGSMFVLNLGLGVFNVSVSTYIVSISGNTQWFFLFLMSQGLGQLISLPFAGRLVQRADPLKIFNRCSAIRATITLLCFLSTYVNHWPGVFSLFALVFAVNDGMQRAALFGSIHEYLSQAREKAIIGHFGSVVAGGTIAGTVTFGIVGKFLGVRAAIACDSIVVLLLFLVLTRVLASSARQRSADDKPITYRDLKVYGAGWLSDITVVLKYRHFFLLLLVCGGDFVFSYALTGTIPALTVDHFGGSTNWITALGIIYWAAIVTGSLFAKKLATRRWFIMFSLLEAGGAFVLAVVPTSGISAVVVVVSVMIICGFSNVQCITYLSLAVQASVVTEAKPRASSLRLFTIALAQVTIMPVMAVSGGISLTLVYLMMAAMMGLFATGGLVWLRHSSSSPHQIELPANKTPHASEVGGVK